jgi:large subunit ribosomal protein L4
MVNVISNLKLEGKIILVMSEYSEMVEISTRNLPNVQTVLYNHLSVYDILNADKLVMTKEALEKIEEVLS